MSGCVTREVTEKVRMDFASGAIEYSLVFFSLTR